MFTVFILEALLSTIANTGICAGAEILKDGQAVWCPQTQDAVYVYTADTEITVEVLPRRVQQSILDWNFYLFRQNPHELKSRHFALLKHRGEIAGYAVTDKFRHNLSGNLIFIKAKYNKRGQLVFAESY